LKHKSIIDFFRDLKEIFDNNGIDWRVPKKDYVYYKDSKAERVST